MDTIIFIAQASALISVSLIFLALAIGFIFLTLEIIKDSKNG